MHRLPVDSEMHPPESRVPQEKADAHEEHWRGERAAFGLLGERGEEADCQGNERDRGGVHRIPVQDRADREERRGGLSGGMPETSLASG